MRVFLDTNVLVSAFATRGLCADVVRLVLAEHELLTGEVNLRELRRVLGTRLRVPTETVTAVEELLREQPVVPRPAEPFSQPLRDRDDAWVLASAVAAEADLLVTGDQDLLEVADQSPVRIVNPRGLWELARGPKGRQS